MENCTPIWNSQFPNVFFTSLAELDVQFIAERNLMLRNLSGSGTTVHRIMNNTAMKYT
jgi:hypothetical protein